MNRHTFIIIFLICSSSALGLDINCKLIQGSLLCDCTTGALGVCDRGVRVCEPAPEGMLPDCGPCLRITDPGPEECNGLDDDCDGAVDEELGEIECGVGICRHIVSDCINGSKAICNPMLGARDEECNSLDDDCDGEIDEALGESTCGKGICEHTIMNCVNGEIQKCDAKEGATEEICNGLDDDCDGKVDENCDCTPGDTRNCGTDIGECRLGIQQCDDHGEWAECKGAILPEPEICQNDLDDDCDGNIDCEDSDCECERCRDECEYGERACSGNGFMICLDIDEDYCVELSKVYSCDDSNDETVDYCSGGSCHHELTKPGGYLDSAGNASELNNAPIIDDIGVITIEAGKDLFFKVNAFDVDNDLLRYYTDKEVIQVDTNGYIWWKTRYNDVGTTRVKLTVTDGYLHTEKEFLINVINETIEKKKSSEEGVQWSFEFWAMLGFFAVVALWFYQEHGRKVHRLQTLRFIKSIEDVYEKFHSQQELCLIELNRIKSQVEKRFAKGDIDEANLNTVLTEIENYKKMLK